jgi:biopolymer transport protein ExbD
MKLESQLPRQSPWLYTVPLLNTILLLLVYFLFSSGFVIQSGVTVTLPKSSSRLSGFDRAHIIAIAAGENAPVYYDGVKVTIDQLNEALERDRKNDRRAIIHADVRAPHGKVQEVESAALAMGFEVAIATTPAPIPTRE